jgi:hypothetical protein
MKALVSLFLRRFFRLFLLHAATKNLTEAQ